MQRSAHFAVHALCLTPSCAPAKEPRNKSLLPQPAHFDFIYLACSDFSLGPRNSRLTNSGGQTRLLALNGQKLVTLHCNWVLWGFVVVVVVVVFLWVFFLKNTHSKHQNPHKTQSKPTNKTKKTMKTKSCQYTLQVYIYVGLGKSVFLMHFWLELIHRRQILVFTYNYKAYLLFKVANYKQLLKNKKTSYTYHISNNPNHVCQS